MDILETIKAKIRSIPSGELSAGVKAVISHIETAEKYFHRATQENEENLFTDVIYRTNHAFEGILKEAYTILTGKNSSKIAPYNIEKYLSGNDIFNPRVLDLFTNYRTEWRNTSTHDYQLFFTQQEAFLAIVSVSAFINILLDQIIEHISFLNEKKETENRIDELKTRMEPYSGLPLFEKITALLVEFSKDLQKSEKELINLSEAELNGKLSGFLSSLEPGLNIVMEPALKVGIKTLRPDMIVGDDPEQIIVEVKRGAHKLFLQQSADAQLLSYLSALKIPKGILYYFPTDKEGEILVEKSVLEFKESKYFVRKVYPESIN